LPTINEVMLKALAHNICCLVHAMFELGINPSFERESQQADPVGI